MLKTWIAAAALLLAACPTVADDIAPFDAAIDHAVGDASMCSAPSVLRYEVPGCDVKPVCGDATMDLCLSLVCSCSGKVIGGCDYYREPFLPGRLDPRVYKEGDSCLPD